LVYTIRASEAVMYKNGETLKYYMSIIARDVMTNCTVNIFT